MKRIVLLAAVVFSGAILFSSCVQKVPEEIKWASSLDDALKTAQEQDRHIIAEFWSDECKWCKRLEDSTFTSKDVVALSQDMVFVKA